MPITKLSITTSAAKILDAGTRDWLIIQNQSDTDWYLAFDGVEASSVTVAAGLKPGILVKAGTSFIGGRNGLYGKQIDNEFWAIHGGSGSKSGTAHYVGL